MRNYRIWGFDNNVNANITENLSISTYAVVAFHQFQREQDKINLK